MRESTVYTEDSRADDNPSVWQEGRKDKKITGISGRNLRGSSEILDQISLSVKTSLESSNLPGIGYVRTWSVKATPSGYSILKLRLSEPCTDGTESSSLPTEATSHLWRTPDANCYRGPSSEERLKMKVEKGMPISLNDQVRHEQLLFPTPTAFDATCGDLKGKEYTGKNRHAMKLIQAAKLYPTPTAHDAKSNASPSEYNRHSPTLAVSVGGGLNPAWVAWLMGLATNWTEIEEL